MPVAPPEAGERPPSKSQLKRESAALRDLGAALLALPEPRLRGLDLPAELLEAVLLGKSLRPGGALKRQVKYIGKLLRGLDAEPVRERLAAASEPGAAATRLLHRLEEWRDRLLHEGDKALDELFTIHPEADRSKLRQLIQAARLERESGRPPRSARLLFRYLRELEAGAS